ncbi:unnamed protein product [Sphacelaria rigidula]
MFGDNEEDGVGPLVMAEDGEEWFPFTLDNLEGIDDDGDSDYGQTDSDNDIDSNSPRAGASGPGPPDSRAGGGSKGGGGVGGARRGGGESEEMAALPDASGGEVGGGENSVRGARGRQDSMKRPLSGGLQALLVPPPKMRLDRVKPDAKEVHGAAQEQRRLEHMMRAETQAQAKRSNPNRGGSVGGGRTAESKGRQRAAAMGNNGVPGDSQGTGTATGRKDSWGSDGVKSRSRGKSSTSSPTTSVATDAADGTGRGDSGGGGRSDSKMNNVQNRRRLERNAREQKRSLKISQRIEDLRRMLSQFGVDVKTSKSAVLSEATEYIAHLQRQQVHFEAERARMLQLLHQANQRNGAAGTSAAPAGSAPATGMGGEGTTGAVDNAGEGMTASTTTATDQSWSTQSAATSGFSWTKPASTLTAAAAVEAVALPQDGAAQGSVGACSLPCDVPGFPELPSARGAATGTQASAGGILLPGGAVDQIRSAGGGGGSGGGGTIQQMASAVSVGGVGTVAPPPPMALEVATARALSHVNYERVFRTSSVPMAIANVNGNLVDCNTRLTLATGFQREEVLFMTIFDLVADPFLQHTFSMISSILNLPGVANPPFFQVLGKRRDGSHGGVVQVSVVQDTTLRPLHFSICILNSTVAATGGGFMAAGSARSASPAGVLAAPSLRMSGSGAGIGGGGPS